MVYDHHPHQYSIFFFKSTRIICQRTLLDFTKFMINKDAVAYHGFIFGIQFNDSKCCIVTFRAMLL
jgi:hypothetical protein